MVAQIEEQRQKLYRQNIIVSLLLFFVIGLAIVIFTQVLKMKKARRIIEKMKYCELENLPIKK